MYLLIFIEQKPLSPAIPATGQSLISLVGVIIVPKEVGLFVFLILTGIPL